MSTSAIPDSVVNPFVDDFGQAPKTHQGSDADGDQVINELFSIVRKISDRLEEVQNQVQASQFDDGSQESSYCKLR